MADTDVMCVPSSGSPGVPPTPADNLSHDEVATPNPSGCTVLQALHDKYGSDEPLDFEIRVSKHAPGKTESGALIIPNILGLNYANISSIGDLSEIATVCARLTDLDLSHNDISEWHQVMLLLQTLPKLHFVNLSCNPLHKSEPLSPSQLALLPPNLSLSKLALNGTKISWNCLWALMEHLPCLGELQFCLNDADHVTGPADGTTFPTVKHLLLNGNKLADIADVLTVGRVFCQLCSLIMIDNLVTTLSMEQSVCEEVFPCLQNINLINCPVQNWSDLLSLRNFTMLKDVKLQGLPLTKEYEENQFRQLVLGYLPNMASVNGTPTTEQERDTAERAFIRFYKYRDDKPDRYHQLIDVHGNVDDLATIDLTPSTNVSVLVKFNEQTVMKSYPLNWTLSKLKTELAKRIVHQPPKKIQVFHKQVRDEYGFYRMIFNDRTLLRYRVEEGDILQLHI